MRTKFKLFATLLMVVLCAGFISCGNDAEEEKQSDKTLALLVGSWEDEPFITNGDNNTTGEVITTTQTEILTFKTDMTWTGVDYYTGTNYPNGMTEKWGEGTYSYDSNSKELTLNNTIFESDIVKILKITETELSYISGDGIMNYTRKK